jgi:DNA-binding protein HU-beta
MPQSLKGTGPQREQGLKARLSLVKVVANPLVLQALLRFRCKKWLIFRPIGLRRQDKNRLTTIPLKHLAAAIAEEQELSKKQAETILTDLVTMITKHLKKGERIRIVGLGILQVRKRAARIGRNPATGEAIQIKASKKVAFRAAKELKEAV